MTTPLRPAARAILLSPDNHILMVRFVFGDVTFWGPPGGGLEGDETHSAALRRELAEETGLRSYQPGPLLYTHQRMYPAPSEGWDGQDDRVWLVRLTERFDPHPELSLAELHEEHVGELRWFSVAELRDVVTLPTCLPELLDRLLAGDAGPTQLDET
jgi:8-oxo-dGTP pyrophosphatase MutT (NUDIX family)